MNLEQALEGLKDLIEFANDDSGEAYYLGKDTWNALPDLEYVYEYAKTMRATPTDHDSAAEFNSWDEFFEDIRKVTNG